MKKTLLLFFTLFSFALSAQTTHNLGWANDGSSDNQQITIEVGDTIIWTWGAGTHNLRPKSGSVAVTSALKSRSMVRLVQPSTASIVVSNRPLSATNIPDRLCLGRRISNPDKRSLSTVSRAESLGLRTPSIAVKLFCIWERIIS